jgi:hypothetical protein
MKNRILILFVLVATLCACSSDSLINDDVNLSLQNADLKGSSKKNAVTRPFKISAQGTWSVFPGDGESCSALVLNALGEGTATHLGSSTLLEEWCWNGAPNELGTRSLTIIADNGDELWGTHNFIQYTSETTFEEVLVFNGGTGRFENATGEFNEYVAITFGDETRAFGTFTLSGVGTLSY